MQLPGVEMVIDDPDGASSISDIPEELVITMTASAGGPSPKIFLAAMEHAYLVYSSRPVIVCS